MYIYGQTYVYLARKERPGTNDDLRACYDLARVYTVTRQHGRSGLRVPRETYRV